MTRRRQYRTCIHRNFEILALDEYQCRITLLFAIASTHRSRDVGPAFIEVVTLNLRLGGPIMLNMIWYDMTWHGMAWHGIVWYDVIWNEMIWNMICDVMWYDTIRYRVILYVMLCYVYGMAWYGMASYHIIPYHMTWYGQTFLCVRILLIETDVSRRDFTYIQTNHQSRQFTRLPSCGT